MPAPTATEIRAILEEYCIDSTIITDAWIESTRDEEVIPHIEDVCNQTFSAETETTEYYSGNGKSVLILNRRPVNEIVSITHIASITNINIAESVELIGEEGMIKVRSNYNEGIYGPIFRKGEKNIKVVYKYGTSDYPDRVKRSIKNLVCAKMLNHLGARTGGGSIGVQAFNRNFGNHGKYTDIRIELVHTAYSLLKKYMTGVVGS